jgi:hypothetical protein
LEQLRRFISYFLTNISTSHTSKLLNPKFIDACAPIQCNPNFENCFGLDENIENEKCVIADQIRNKLCDSVEKNCNVFTDITFCLFNVINLNPKTNNPPPIPYIDISNLMGELIRLESIDQLVVSDISDHSKNMYVHPSFLKEIYDSPLLEINSKNPGTIKGEQLTRIRTLIEALQQTMRDVEQVIETLKDLIDVINKINSLTLIGTLEFTDMIAKFGLNKMVCNYNYKKDMSSGVQTGSELLDIKQSLLTYKTQLNEIFSSYRESIINKVD